MKLFSKTKTKSKELSELDILPEMSDGMRLDEALYLELMHILVEEKIITENKAISKYIKRFPDV